MLGRTGPWSAGRAEAAFVAGTLVTFVLVVSTTLGQPLLERHAFRQTQTAFTARIFHEQGIDLIHPKLPVLGEPFEAPFEFPLFQAAAALVMDAGVRDDVAMRLTALACFVLTACLLYGLVRRVDGTASALGALVAFVSTPFALLWGRASMIEFLATAGAVGFAWATIAWRENRHPGVGGLALAAGLVGMLVKPTTAVFWILPALGYRPTTRHSNRRTALLLGVFVLVPLAAALLWTRHADSIKAASPTTAWLTSEALREWNFGTLSQRLDAGTWGVIVSRVLDYVLGPVGLILLAVAIFAAAKSSQRLFWLGIGLAGVLPPLVFTNLYLQHDYYLAAVTPALAALVGLGFGQLWRLLPRRPAVQVMAAACALAVVTAMLVIDRDYWALAFADDPDPGTLALAEEASTHTESSDRVGVVGLDWSPAVLYYANRWGHMVVERNREAAFDDISADGYRYLLVRDPSEESLEGLSRWRWLGALSNHSYAIADDASGLQGAELVATDDPALAAPAKTLDTDIRVQCDQPTRLPSGRRGTLLRISNPSPELRVSASDELASLPARRWIFVGPRLAEDESLRLTCSGQRSVVVDVLEAPLPS